MDTAPQAWAGLEVRHLLALRAIADHGSFHRAAAQLDYTQSGVSQQVAALERIVGAQLVERPGGSRPVRLTAAGAALLEHARAILDRVTAARADLAAPPATLRVGAFQSVGATLLPPLLDRLATEAPDLRIELTQATSDEPLLDAVRAGDLDVAFAMLPVPPGPFATAEMLVDPFVLVVAADSELAARGAPVTLADLDGVPLVAPRCCRIIARLESRMRDAGLTPLVSHRADDDGTVLGLVACGAGVACVPRLVAAATDARHAVLELADPMDRRIALAWHADRVESTARVRFAERTRAMTNRHRVAAIS